VNIADIHESLMVGQKPDFVPFPNRAWIAGGAIRRWFAGTEELSDVDVFFPSQEVFDAYVQTLTGNGFSKTYVSQNADTYSNGKHLVQCIKVNFFKDVNELFDSFDFTLCQFAWDGNKIYSTTEAIISVLRKHLGVHKIKEEFAVDSLRRAFKYCSKGYKPCSGTIIDLANSMIGLTKEKVATAVEISPAGGKRIIRID